MMRKSEKLFFFTSFFSEAAGKCARIHLRTSFILSCYFSQHILGFFARAWCEIFVLNHARMVRNTEPSFTHELNRLQPELLLLSDMRHTDCMCLKRIHSISYLLVTHQLNVDVRNQPVFPQVKGRKWEQWITKYQSVCDRGRVCVGGCLTLNMLLFLW